jgi:hypothetical protein
LIPGISPELLTIFGKQASALFLILSTFEIREAWENSPNYARIKNIAIHPVITMTKGRGARLRSSTNSINTEARLIIREV